MRHSIFLLALIFSFSFAHAQTGTIKGQVLDQQSELAVIGATVELLSVDPLRGGVTDIDGYFSLSDVPVGRHVVRVSYLGYETITLPNIEVNTGKDVILNLTIQEALNQLDEVVVTAETNKDQAQNELATISARQFSVEEVNRYSGGRSDVGRLAANFAGVSSPDDSRNDIVIRGNSPAGVLWRLEGIPIPNPNHFSTLGTTGGPVSAVNPNLLANSDFMTSAFPAEYGNANAGVFDLSFRNGNKDRNEYMLQLGAFTGFEGMAEGPLGKNGGSFLVAGRYSFVGIVGAGSTSAVPNYQDISFKVDLGNSPIGRFTIFGIGGRSNIDFLGAEVDSTDLFAAEDEDLFVVSDFGVVGVKHNLVIGNNSYVRTVVGASTTGSDNNVDRYFELGTAEEFKVPYAEIEDRTTTLSVSSYYNSKLNAKQTLRAGILFENISANSFFRTREDIPDFDGDGINDFFTVYDFEGSFSIIQPFVQTKYRLTEKIELNAGLHGQYSTLNEQFVIEPRASVSYGFNDKNKLTLGYGMHNQNAPLPILFLNEDIGGELVRTNEDLEFTRSQHFVLGYDSKIAKDWRLKAEVYYQLIDRVPVDPFSSSYSTLTEGADFIFTDDATSLVNEGTGFNRGVEITLEKFYSRGFYTLLTGSLFESRYEGSDGIERNTPFNNGCVVNLLGGKEIPFGKNKIHSFSINTRLSTAGGRYFTPIDLEASRIAGTEVLREDQAFSEQIDAFFRADLRIGVKINSKKRRISNQFYFDFQNITNRENVFVQRYNRLTNEINTVNQLGFFPDFLYRIQF